MSNTMRDLLISAPISGSGDQASSATQTVDGVLCLATSASSQLVKIPALWLGRELMVEAIGLDVDILFGTASVSVTVNQASALDGSGNPTLNAATGSTVFAGTKEILSHVNCSGQTHFAFRSSGTTGFLKVRPADVRHADKS